MLWCASLGAQIGWLRGCTSTPPSCRCLSPTQSLSLSHPGLLLLSSSPPLSYRYYLMTKVHCFCDCAG